MVHEPSGTIFQSGLTMVGGGAKNGSQWFNSGLVVVGQPGTNIHIAI